MIETKKEIKESIEVKNRILDDINLLKQIDDVSQIVLNAYKKGNKTIFAGNGGSAADSQHLAAEFVSRFYFDRPALSSIALTTDTSILTAIGNDYGYDKLFERQIDANGNKDDVFFGISTSGNSPNIINALKACEKLGIYRIGLTGQSDSKMLNYCDIVIQVPSTSTPRIQECHILIGHIICGFVEEMIYGDKKK